MNHENRNSHQSRRRSYAVVAIVALAVLVAAGFLVRRQEARTNTTEPIATTPKTPADTVEATPEQLRQVHIESVREMEMASDLETTGKIGFNEDRMTPVFAPYSGRVLELLANKGDVVQPGQALLVIESPDLVSTVHDLTEARADAEKAKIAVDIADKAAARALNLHSLDALATKELQAAESELARAREDYRRATAAVSVVQNKLFLFGKTADEIRRLEESVDGEFDHRITIRAPLGGTIVDRKVGPGQYIKPDTPDPLYLIDDLSTVWVNADIYETHLKEVHVGAPVTIAVAAYPDRAFPARIAAINPTLDPATRTIRVRCAVPNPNGLLKPEMFASIRIGDSVKKKVAAVPSSAVLTQGADSFVLREEAPSKFRRRAIKTGAEANGYTVIEEGLTGGDRVVTTGVLLLSNAMGGK
jgi:membrane fusion protein, heavy metal efflux system